MKNMSATERTSLTRSTVPITYVEYTDDLRYRRSKIRQFQCCAYAILLTIFVMTLVMSVSFIISRVPNEMENSSNLFDATLVKMAMPSYLLDGNVKNKDSEVKYLSLSDEEWLEAVKIGNQAIEMRLNADESANSFSPDEISPNIRHRHAVSTSPLAGRLALAGTGELAASRYIEKSRKEKKMPSAIGAFFDGLWSSPDIFLHSCEKMKFDNMNLQCNFMNKYRNLNGSCNHPKNRGAAFTPFMRVLKPDYADGIESPRRAKSGNDLPSAREISLRVHAPSPSSNPSFTVMLAVFGQFLDHDMTATAISQKNISSLACCPPNPGHPECFPVAVGPGDPVYDIKGSKCMEFVRSAPAKQCKIGPRQQLNQVTGFIDGSVIYGSDDKTAKSLREFKSGRLRMFKTPEGRELLPQSTDPSDGCNRNQEKTRGRYCFTSGDARANENLHLTTMHLLWARQHNFIANRLAKINPSWSDEMLYQETRRIIGAQLQHITYNEFIPVILGESQMILRQLKPLDHNQYRNSTDHQTDPSIANNFASSAFRFAHTLLPGLMKITDAQKGTDDYIQLHKMLFNPYSLYGEHGVDRSVISATSNFIQRTSTHVTSELTRHLFEDPLSYSQRSKPKVPCGLDLVSLNIQRGRDHGLPGYTTWREYCNLTRPMNFDELYGIMDNDTLKEVKKLYENVDDIDLYTGALAEINFFDGIVGPTFKCLIGEQFERLQRGDRFWYESADQPYPFTEDQLSEIRKTSLAKLICDCSDGISQIQPEVMKSIDETNRITSCDDLPAMNFMFWKEN